MTEKKQTKSKPFSRRVGKLQVSIFTNLDEETGIVSFSTYIKRSWFVKKRNEWVNIPFSEEDLDDLPKARELAMAYIANQKQKLSPQQLEQPQDPSFVDTVLVPAA